MKLLISTMPPDQADRIAGTLANRRGARRLIDSFFTPCLTRMCPLNPARS